MKKKLPNIIFIVMDTMGAKHMSLYGYPRRTTPNLDRIAEECTVYSRCFAPSCWTIPSHASMFTGLYPSQHGAVEGRFYLNTNLQHLVSVLKKMGYQAFGISSNGLVSPASGLCRDFDYFKDFFKSQSKALEIISPYRDGQIDELSMRLLTSRNRNEKTKIMLDHLLKTGRFNDVFRFALNRIKIRLDQLKPNPQKKSSRYTEKTLKILQELMPKFEQNDGKPFFVFINFYEVHERYRPPLQYRQFSRWYHRQTTEMLDFYKRASNPQLSHLMNIYGNLYDDEINYLDHKIYEIWNMIKKASFNDDTLIVITSDHGEHFGEKNLYHHTLSLYNELIWVPLLIRFPRSMKGTGSTDRLVSLNDIYSTFLEMVDSPLPLPKSSVSLLSGSKRELCLSQFVYPEFYPELKEKQKVDTAGGHNFSPPIMALLTDAGKKIIERRDGIVEVYDLRHDMGETTDLTDRLAPETIEQFRGLLEVLKEETGYYNAFKEAQEFYQPGIASFR
jgi:arylsulfatase A-like enzyme